MLRKISFLLVLTALANSLTAQSEPTKSVYLGGTVSFTTRSSGLVPLNSGATLFTSASRTNSFRFNPYIMGQQSEKWDFGLGLSANYQVSKNVLTSGTNSVAEDVTNSSFGIGMLGRRWLVKGSKVNVFIQPGAYVSFGESDFGSQTTTFLSITASVPVGLSYQLGKRFRVIGLVNAISATVVGSKADGTDRVWNDTVQVGTPAGVTSLGFEYSIR